MPPAAVHRSLQQRADSATASRSISASPRRPASHPSRNTEGAALRLSQLSSSQQVTRAQTRNIVTLPPQIAADVRRSQVIAKIEQIFEQILDKVADDSAATELLLPFWTRPVWLPGRLESSQPSFHWVKFPGDTLAEAKKFAGMLCILRCAHEAMLSGTPVNKRNIFYQNPELFESQRVVDKLVDDIAYTFGVGRDTLNIVAAAKGLIAGNIGFGMRDGSVTSGKRDGRSGLLIPPVSTIDQIDFSSATWLLVIEKDATFATLTASRFCDTCSAGPGILVTAKGYPDLLTRQFLHTVHQHRPRLPIFGLFDFDPDGIAILRNYKNGSLQLAHEEGCTVPGMIWIGLKSVDILGISTWIVPEQLPQAGRSQNSERRRSLMTTDDKSLADAPTDDGNLLLTTRDRRMAVKLLAQICDELRPNEEDAEQKQELQRMLMLNIKAEMQAVDNLGNIAQWLDERLRACLRPSA